MQHKAIIYRLALIDSHHLHALADSVGRRGGNGGSVQYGRAMALGKPPRGAGRRFVEDPGESRTTVTSVTPWGPSWALGDTVCSTDKVGQNISQVACLLHQILQTVSIEVEFRVAGSVPRVR